MTKTDMLIAAVVLGWACGSILRDLAKPKPPERRKRRKRAVVKSTGKTGPISMDEAHSIAWSIYNVDDLIAHIQQDKR